MKNLLAKKVKKNNKGFTLVELIIVIAIIAMLVAVLAPNYVKYVDRSRWSSDRNDCETLLSEVKTGIVDVQNDGGTVTDFTLTVDKDGVQGWNDVPSDLKAELDKADSKWKDIKVKHKNKQSLPGESSGAAKDYKKFTIKYKSDAGSVSSGWSE